jgi:hypothetical protein
VDLHPDQHGSALILVGWIYIRIQESKNDPQKAEIRKINFMLLIIGCSLLRDEDFYCSLKVLHGEQVINKLQL